MPEKILVRQRIIRINFYGHAHNIFLGINFISSWITWHNARIHYGATLKKFYKVFKVATRGFALTQATKVLPEILDYAEVIESIAWDEEPWSKGDYAWLKPGDAKRIWPYLSSQEGRIHFAGEHTSTWFLHGSMQGALESGIRVAKTISNA